MKNQPLTSKEFKFNNIHSIVNNTIFNVILDNNPNNSNDVATLEAPEDQINKIHLIEKNGTLIISADNINADNGSYSNVSISLVLRHVTKIKNTSCGELEGNTVGKSLEIDSSGTGDISLDGEAHFIEIVNSGTGNFSGNLNCETMKIDNSGTGDIEVKGSTASLNIANTGAGSANLSNFKAEKIDFYASGTGDLEIYATKEISGKSTGVGDVTYSGIKNVFIQNTGVGSVDYGE